MLYVMRETQLRQWELPEAAVILALSLVLAIGMGEWMLCLLGGALALSLLRDAYLLRRKVREGQVWICEGRVRDMDQRTVTLTQNGTSLTLRLSRPLRLKIGDQCSLALLYGKRGYELLGVRRQACSLQMIAFSV